VEQDMRTPIVVTVGPLSQSRNKTCGRLAK